MKLFRKTSGKKSRFRMFAAMICLAFAAGIGWLLFNPTDTSAAWYNTTWNYRKQLTIDYTKVSGGADLTNFPVLVSLTDSNLNAALSTGNDILFTSSDGTTKLSHEIESFTQSTGTLVAWVKIPTLSASIDTKIYIYWGNSGAASQQDVTNVWDTSYKRVYHLNETSGTTTTDSTGAVNGTKVSATQPNPAPNGLIGGAQDWNGTDACISSATTGLPTGDFTYGIWVKLDTLQTFDDPFNASGAMELELYLLSDGSYTAAFGSGGSAASATGVVSTGSWKYLVATRSGSSVKVYINGAQSGSTGSNGNAISQTTLYMGCYTGNNDWIDGLMDEAKISDTARSDGWIATEYNNQSAPATFFSQSKVESKNSPVLYWKFDEGTNTTANDSSANSNVGTLGASTAAPTWQTEDQCINGKCLKFDGSNDYLSRTYSNDTELLPGTVGFSVSAWIRHPTAITGTDTIIARSNGAVNGIGYKLYMNSSGFICFGIDDDVTTFPEDSACSTTSFADSKWHFIEGVKSGTSSITLYIDGQQAGQDATLSATGTLSGSSATVFVGIDSDATSNPWDGFIDEVKYFDFAKTAAQVKSDYASKGSLDGTAASFGAGDQTTSLSQGLLGYWKMDETSWAGTCSGTPVLDSSGNGHHGNACPNGSAPSPGAGKFGNGGVFDNTNDVVTVTTTTALSPANAITLSTWFKVPSSTTIESFINKGATGNVGYDLYMTNGSVMEFNLGINSTEYDVVSNSTLDDGTWHHVVGTYDGSVMKMYIDGVLQTDTVSIAGTITYNSSDISLGSNANGTLDDMRIYNRALSGSEVATLYDWAPGPLGEWNFNERTGTTVNDISGNANTGTWQGTTGSQWGVGKFGAGGLFNGTNNYVSTNNNAPMQITNGTIQAWIKTSSAGSGYRGIITKNNAFNILVNDNVLVTYDECGGGERSTGINIADNAWHHVAMSFESGTSAIIYLDGIPVLNASITICAQDTELRIGTNDTLGQFFNGSIDNAKIYNYMRTPKQIIQDMNAGAPAVGGVGTPGNAVGFWSFDEGYGTTAYDKSPNRNHGTLTTATSTWTNAAKFGKAWIGTGSQWVTVTDDANDEEAYDFLSTEDFSISLWLKCTSNPGGTRYVLGKANTTTQGYAIQIFTDGDVAFAVDDDTTWGPDKRVGDSANVSKCDSNWHHIIGTKEGTRRMSIYIDGKHLESNSSGIPTATLANTLPFVIGDFDTVDNASEFEGSIDEVKIYRYALNADEVKAEYNQGSSQTLGSTSTASNGTTADNSAAREYCIPGDATSCSAPVGEWKFDERTGTTANDTTGNNNTGTLAGGPNWIPGKVGSGLLFDGVDDAVNVPDANSLDLSTAATIGFWIKLNTTAIGEPSSLHVVDKWLGTGNQRAYQIVISSSSDKIRAEFSADGIAMTASPTSDNGLTVGTWYYYTVVYDGTTVSQYLNGVKQVDTDTLGGIFNSTSQLTFANNNDGGNSTSANVSMDKIQFFNYARTQAQVNWSYNQGGPVGWWKFDECSGATANDSSGNGNNGTITPGSAPNSTVGTCNSNTTSEMWSDGSDTTRGTSGKFNGSLGFDGSDDYVTVDTDLPTVDFTYSAWVYPTSSSLGQVLMVSTGSGGNELGIIKTATFNQIQIVLDSATLFTSNQAITLNTWSHLVLTRSSGTVTLSINGKSASTGTDSDTLSFSTCPLLIGTDNDTSGCVNSLSDYFTGQIDDVRVYNYSLTATQIKTLHNENSALRFGQ
ncbi:MAG: DUF2341 domain-containing protein [bacterium]|nr:DUF2341 domain-containing protein [bacterium]